MLPSDVTAGPVPADVPTLPRESDGRDPVPRGDATLADGEETGRTLGPGPLAGEGEATEGGPGSPAAPPRGPSASTRSSPRSPGAAWGSSTEPARSGSAASSR